MANELRIGPQRRFHSLNEALTAYRAPRFERWHDLAVALTPRYGKGSTVGNLDALRSRQSPLLGLGREAIQETAGTSSPARREG